MTTGIYGPSFIATSFYRSRDIRYENFENDVFLGLFSHVFTGGRTSRFLCDFLNRDFVHQMTSERETAIMFVVFLSLYKMVKEFLRYLYSFQNGAIPKISPKTTKNDPTLEPPGGPTFRLGQSEFHSVHNFFHPTCDDVGPVYKSRIELRLKIRPIWSRQKIRTSVRPEVEIEDRVPSKVRYPEKFPIDPENFGFLARPVPEIS